MANLAYQVTNHAYQGDGLFVYQGSTGGAVVVPPPPIPPGNLNWLKKKRVKRRLKRTVDVPQNELVVELQKPVETSSLQQILMQMEEAGFRAIEEDEEDALILTFILKKFH